MRSRPRASAAALLSFSLSSLACGGNAPAAEKAVPPAKVTGGVSEAALTTVTLSPEASRRLGIDTASIEQRGVTRTRSVGGEVIPAGGAQSTVTAPVAGTLEAGGSSTAGASVSRGTVVMRLVPFAPAERDVRIEAERVVNEARGRQVLASQRVDRATKLAADGSGSRRAAEEAQADLVVANAALKAAEDRLALASRGVSATGALALVAPFDGVVQAIHAAAGQSVAAGAPLFDLVRLDVVWVRVPLYAGDIAQVERAAVAHVAPLGSTETVVGAIARPIAAPPSADPATAAVDLYYAVANARGGLRPGERVSVRVPLAAATSSLVVPRAALLHDAYGGSWVYEAREGGVFIRRRVSVVDLVDDVAVLDQGPPPGTRVVTAGAAELFGTEFGVGK